MLRVSHLRKLVKPQSCPEIPINLQGTELGAPVSIGATVTVVEGQVTATGTGYDFVAGVLEVTPAPDCSVPNYTTFTISGTGPVPDMSLCSTTVALRCVLGHSYTYGGLYAAYRHPTPWALGPLPITTLPGDPYELVIVVADSYVRAWLNGVSMGRRDLYADYLGPPGQWRLEIGSYSYSGSYTGHIDSIRWEVGALYPDVDNI